MNHKIKKFLSYYKPYMGLFLTDMLFAVIGAGVTLVIPLIVRYITDHVVLLPSGEAFGLILKLGIMMLGLVLWNASVIFILHISGILWGRILSMICAMRYSHIIRSCLLPFMITRK